MDPIHWLIVYFVGFVLMSLYGAYIQGEEGKELNFEGVMGCFLLGALWPVIAALLLVALPLSYMHHRGKRNR